MNERRWCWQDFRSSEKKPEVLEHSGWHKVGWILCLLLTTFFWLSLLILNPANKKFASIGYRLIDTCHFIMNTRYNCSIIFGVAIWWTTDQCYWLFFTFLSDTISYWKTWARICNRYWQLSWWWCLLLFASHWNDTKRRPWNINGTYWTNVQADQHEILSEFKDLKRKHQALDYRSIFSEVYEVFWLHIKMMTLNTIGLAYFTTRIFLYRVGYHVMPSRHKRTWSTQRKQGR